ncbi:MAG TPA: glycosyl transferase [Leeuwenhoekiella sp.]|mgnify:CR=1 FL=1|nr:MULTISPECIES: glycosyltransferase family 4 protein [Leeuwenhoekiella]MAO44672.1 glycosyl transferase [Leeuwenhoekiella sp.]HBT08485.1 glycosyl transferase [Leeuwenhoekiella sp.]HCW64229.1 glycosyl transferase [Leeuwenhoekiella sp.]|tara:strand:- start:7662 stop:8771 length:1110 start_codon:yes stop_codon:yes gene_type:complete
MNLLVISSAPILRRNDAYVAYAPYVREMDIWFEQLELINVVCPTKHSGALLTEKFERQDLLIHTAPNLYIGNLKGMLCAIIYIPLIVSRLIREMQAADHIHLRCPGNIGLLGALVQLFFPQKKKTAKYAGNWDPKAKQPWSYNLQKWILSNSFLTRNMQVLVYGDWPHQSKNIKSFFTATYTEADKKALPQRKYDLPLRFLFVGSLVPGKRPLYALELVNELISKGFPAELHFYGDGPQKELLLEFIAEHHLEKSAFLHGNQSASVIAEAYTKSHFLILPSKSEGWPKAIAEAMWWGVIPIATPISCVPWMLDHGDRGVLVDAELESDITKLEALLKDKARLKHMAQKASEWSRTYTLDLFEAELKKLL